MIVFEPVQAAIWHCLNHYSYDDAIFLAERLYAEVECDESLFLLATCYYRSGLISMAYSTLKKKDAHSPQIRCLLAKCCVDLQKYAEAESILTGQSIMKSKEINDDDIISEFGDESCFVFKILAIIASKTHRIELTAEMYKKSLKLNPFLWHSFEQLCNLGYEPDPNDIFTVSKMENFTCCHGINPVVNYVNNNLSEKNYPVNNSSSHNNMDLHYKSSSTPVQLMNVANSGTCAVRLFATPEENIPMTPSSLGIATLSSIPSSKVKKNSRFRSMFSPIQIPSFGLLPFNFDTGSPADNSSALTPDIYDSKNRSLSNKETPLQQGKPVFSQSGNTSNTANIVNSNQSNSVTPPLQSVRRSTRLFSSSCSVKENNKSPKHGKFVSPKSPSRKTKRGVSKTNLSINSFNEITVNNNEKNRNNDKNNIPVEQITNEKNSVSISMQALQIQKDAAEGLMTLLRDIGTAYLNLSKFECLKAIECFNNLSPSQRNTGWVLAMIAKAYYELPDYPNSIKYFRKVRETDPERLLLTELYSTALWFLQRSVYSKQEKYELALAHYYMAESINPKNVVILCHIGVVQNARQKTESALNWLGKALAINPKSALCKFHRAKIYFNIGRHVEALKELEQLKQIVPKESLVYYLIGKLHKKLGNTHLALMHFSWAMDLDPKGTHTQIKESIDPSLSRGPGEDGIISGQDTTAENEVDEGGSIEPNQQPPPEHHEQSLQESDESF
ncbi:cell division cycle, putative [Pediculus humanus corporis]|uniref:Cell division cycle protein 27 homolog n=1 Tax=Pediculus humanus subsp. corporis TaxID=121224 RepID=E0VL43_PEDHC|nr:cell division cycle, putative [Pediculus humanus corporis]EEB14099.1 cell division cycle, putative [Pediculus humanus corporis]